MEASQLFSLCSNIHFGRVTKVACTSEFYPQVNQEFHRLYGTLPVSVREDAFSFLMEYTKASFPECDFLRMYYSPSWSILYWLPLPGVANGSWSAEDMDLALATHVMAMFLHALDDHLCDQQTPTTHLTLLLRGQAWMRMSNSAKKMAEEIDGGDTLVEHYFDNYYSGIRATDELHTLNEFCDRFRQQMATWLLTPALVCRKMKKSQAFADDIERAYGSFGVAWRILDDIQDLEADIKSGAHSAVYVCLPPDLRTRWMGLSEAPEESAGAQEEIAKFISRENVIERLTQRIHDELQMGGELLRRNELQSFASEYEDLLGALKNVPSVV